MEQTMDRKEKIKKWVIWYLRQPFVSIVWFMETFSKNRAITRQVMSKSVAVTAFKVFSGVTIIAWLAFAAIATDEQKARFTDAVTGFYGFVDEAVDERDARQGN